MRNPVPEALLDKVFGGKIEQVLSELPPESIDCIFADPDYNVGVKYEGRSQTQKFDSYIRWCEKWAEECFRVLKSDGNLFIVNYPKNNAYLRVRYLDQHFSKVHEYAWVYHSNIGHGSKHFTTAHRTILHCVKSISNRFYKNAVAVPYMNPEDRRIRLLTANGSLGRMPYSWFEFNLVKNVGTTKTFHSCQIPESLSEMLFRATTKPGDVVLVLFGGAGSELAVCQRLGLHFVSAEIEPAYRALIRARLSRHGLVPAEFRMMTAIQARRRKSKRLDVDSEPLRPRDDAES